MIRKRWMPGSAVTALACLIAIGCGDGNQVSDGGDRPAQNRPPVIVKDSLRWTPTDEAINMYVPYSFTVQATDPDIGDTIKHFEWVVGNTEEDEEYVIFPPTSGSFAYTFEPNSATSHQTIELSVRATDNRGAIGPFEVFSLPVGTSEPPLLLTAVAPAQALNFRIDPEGSVSVAYDFTVTDRETNPVSIGNTYFDPGETAATFSPQPVQISPTQFRFNVTYRGSIQNPDRTLSPSLRVEDVQGRSSLRVTFPNVNIQTITTPNRTPQIIITSPPEIDPPAFTSKPVSLAFTIRDEDNDDVSYTVNWGDGTTPDAGVVSGTQSGANVTLTHVFPDTFTASTRNSTMTITVNDGRANGTATETRTWRVTYNTYPTGRIILPQSSNTLPTPAELPSNPATGLFNPPGPNDADIIVIPRNGRVNFQGFAEPPGSGDTQLTYSWTFAGGTPSASSTLIPEEVVYGGVDNQIIAYPVEFTVRDAFGRYAHQAGGITHKTYRKWIVVDGKNSQTFNIALKYRLLPDGTLSTVKTAPNGLGTASIDLFQDGTVKTYVIMDDVGQNAEIKVPVRSNLPLWVKLSQFGSDDTNYMIRIPNSPVGEFADPSLGVAQRSNISSFFFENPMSTTNSWNPTLHVVTSQGYADEGRIPRFKNLSGHTEIFDGVIPATHNRWVDMLALHDPVGDPPAVQWRQPGSNAAVAAVSLRTLQEAPEWPVLIHSDKAANLPPDVTDVNEATSAAAEPLNFTVNYSKYTQPSQDGKPETYAVFNMQAFKVPGTEIENFDLDAAGWRKPSCLAFNWSPYSNANRPGMNPKLVDSSVSRFFSDSIYRSPGILPLSGGFSTFDLFFDPNDPNWERQLSRWGSVDFYPIRSTFSYAEYLKSPQWARPLVLNTSNLDSLTTVLLGLYPYFRYSDPANWPHHTGGSFNPAFDMTPSAGSSFSGGNTVGRFYWTAYTPFYDITGANGGTVISRTWLADDSHEPPTSFIGGAGDATSAWGFAPPLATGVDKRARKADGTADPAKPLDGYRVRWFNPTRDMIGDVVPPDFWVVEFVRDGEKFHYMLPPNFPNAPHVQSATDQIVTDARVDNGNLVGKGYCWFDIPVELRADIDKGVPCYLTVFAVKYVQRADSSNTEARPLNGPEWIDAIKTVTATVNVSSNNNPDLSSAHKIPFNYAWDIVVVNGDRVVINP